MSQAYQYAHVIFKWLFFFSKSKCFWLISGMENDCKLGIESANYAHREIAIISYSWKCLSKYITYTAPLLFSADINAQTTWRPSPLPNSFIWCSLLFSVFFETQPSSKSPPESLSSFVLILSPSPGACKGSFFVLIWFCNLIFLVQTQKVFAKVAQYLWWHLELQLLVSLLIRGVNRNSSSHSPCSSPRLPAPWIAVSNTGL